MFSVKRAVKTGWDLTFGNFTKIFFLTIFTYLPSIILLIFRHRAEQSTIFQFVMYFLQGYLNFGYINFMLRGVKGAGFEFRNLFIGGGKFFKLIVGSILYVLLILVGFVLLIFPAFIWGIKYVFFPWFIIDRDAGIIESLELSGQITMGNKWLLLWFGIVLSIIGFFSWFVIILGVFVGEAITTIAMAGVFLFLSGGIRAAADDSKDEQILDT